MTFSFTMKTATQSIHNTWAKAKGRRQNLKSLISIVCRGEFLTHFWRWRIECNGCQKRDFHDDGSPHKGLGYKGLVDCNFKTAVTVTLHDWEESDLYIRHNLVAKGWAVQKTVIFLYISCSDLDFEDKWILLHDTLVHDDASACWIWLQKVPR